MSDVEITIDAIADERGRVVQPALLAAAERVHRQLRPHLPADYPGRLAQILQAGAHMLVARVGGEVAGVAVYRFIENTAAGRKLYVDDLVTDERCRSSGVGHAMLARLEAEARAGGCQSFDLDSGTQRQQAHKFYFREGFTVVAFSFHKPLV